MEKSKTKNQKSKTQTKNKKYFVFGMCLLFLVFDVWFLASCGGEVESPQGITFSESQGNLGYVHLNVSNAVGAINQYRLKISGEGLSPIEQTFSSQAAGVVMNGIPAGANRTIQIQALNVQGQVLREGIVENIFIEAGKQQTLEISLQAVPLLLNLKEGTALSNQRLYFRILTDPNHRVGVEGLSDVVTGEGEVAAKENGELRFYPGVLAAGDHTFHIFDKDSGKSVALSLHLWEGQDVFAAPLVSASTTFPSRLGQALATESFAENFCGELFPNIAEALWRTK